MGAPAKLAGFAVLLLATFGAAFGIGRAVGPVDGATSPTPSATTTTTMVPGHGGHP